MKNKVSKIVISMLIASFFMPNLVDAKINGRRRSAADGAVRENSVSNSLDTKVVDGSVVNTSAPMQLDPNFGVRQQTQEDKKELKELHLAVADLKTKIGGVQAVCGGIASNLNTIFNLNMATTFVSSAGVGTAASALAVGVMKNKDGVGEKSKKTLGHVRTGLMAASAATSGVSVGTSAAASVNAGQVAEKMKQCNAVLGELRSINNKVKALVDYNNKKEEAKSMWREDIERSMYIISSCKGFDMTDINTIKNSMTASAVISGIGTATAITGTATSAIANTDMPTHYQGTDPVAVSNAIRAEENKRKKLDLTSNIMAGITAGTSLTTTAVSGAVLNKAKKLAEIAASCERSF